MKIGIVGFTGRVGQILVKELQSGNHPGLSLAGGLSRPNKTTGDFPVFFDRDEFFASSESVIDFSSPESTLENIRLAARHKKPLVIGTTGLKQEHHDAMKEAAEKTAILYAANMSVGVNILLALVEQAAARLGPEWDIEIFEAHHKHKLDAPSGTALALGNAARDGRKGTGGFAEMNRSGKRSEGDIGFAVSRGGDVVGEHTVTFYGAGERVELTHKATDRALFAHGALKAAQWLHGKPPGLYAMRDVLGL